MPRYKRASKPNRADPGDYESAKSIARIIVKQGKIGKYAGLFDFTCMRLAGQPGDRESVELLAHLKSLRRGDFAGDEFDEAEPARSRSENRKCGSERRTGSRPACGQGFPCIDYHVVEFLSLTRD